jgi:hypothetical protein
MTHVTLSSNVSFVLFVNVAMFSLVVALSVCRNELLRDSAVCEASY